MSDAAPARYAVATLLTDDSYLPGALTCIHSLHDAEADQPAAIEHQYETVCLVTPATVSVEAIKLLKKHFDKVQYCEAIQSFSAKELALLGRPELKNTLTKLHLFRYTEYTRILFLDADTLVLRPISHIFGQITDRPLSAAPDVGWPDAFNSGVMLLSPDQGHFDGLMQLAQDTGSWDGGDQGLLNDYFEGNWNRVSFTYNVTPSAYYQYEPAMRRYGSDIKVAHFIGQNKPWSQLHRSRSNSDGSVDKTHSYEELLSRWFDVFERHFGQQSTASLLTSSLGSKPQAQLDVPRYSSRWDNPQETTSYTPQNPDQLKAMFAQNSSILAQYASFGFTPGGDYQTASASASDPSSVPHQQPEQPHGAPVPSPPMFPWDATKEEADKTKLQMAKPMDHHYDNAWDTPTRESRQFFNAPKEARQVPSSIRSNYSAVMNQQPKQSQASVFPWEQEVRPRPTRVFPDGSPTRQQQDSSSSTSSSSTTTPQAAMPAQRPLPPTQATDQSLAASANSAPAKALGGLPKDLGYTNAWDSIRGIKKYVNTLEEELPSRTRTRIRQPSAPSPPETRRRDKPDTRRRTKSEASSLTLAEDGDDEDDDDEGTAKVVASMKRFNPLQRKDSRSRPEGLTVPIANSSLSRSPINRSLPLPTPDVEAPPSMPGNIMSVHKRRISLNSTGGSTASRNRARKSPLPSPGLAAASHHQKLPNPTAKRVFHPSTDTSIIRKEGEAAYNRYIDILESKGQQAEAQDAAGPSASARGLPSFPSPPLRPSP